MKIKFEIKLILLLHFSGLLGPNPFMASPFGGLGSLGVDALGSAMGSPGSLGQSPVSPSTGVYIEKHK